MNKLIEEIQKEQTIGFTENGALTFTSTLNANLDFFALASAKRSLPEEAVELFKRAYSENLVTAIVNLFYLRDIRKGQGEREIFRQCIGLIDKDILRNPNFIKLIPEYGRWDDALELILLTDDEKVHTVIGDVVWEQLQQDAQTDHPSLLAKWFPLPNSVSNQRRKRIGKNLIGLMYSSLLGKREEKFFRLLITEIRRKIQLVEQYLSEKKYNRIQYDHVPSRAFLKYRKAFNRKDPDRFKTFLKSVNHGDVKINTSCVYPHEVIARIRQHENEEILNEIWKNLPKIQTKGNILTVVDISGSMRYSAIVSKIEPMDISIGLGIYTAENNTGAFKDHIVTFSEKPKLLRIPNGTIAEKYRYTAQTGMGYNTNIEAVFDLLLHVIKKNHVPLKDIPKTILIISDMEFDKATCNLETGHRVTNFEKIKQKFNEAKIPLPHLTFWNVCSRRENIPVRKDENETTLISGCSSNILEFICNGTTPEEFMNKVLFSKRYEPILKIIKK